jgi:hypothetical protein
MNYFSQFKEMLETVENEEVRGQLKEGLTKLQGVFDEAIETRDKAKAKNRDFTTLSDAIAKQFDIEGDLSVDALAKVLDKTPDNDEIKSKYEGQLNELRNVISQKDNDFASLQKTNEDLIFSTEIENGGLLKGFITDDPLLKSNVISHIKNSFIYRDGKMFVKDENGEPAKNIQTGEYIQPVQFVDNMRKDPMWSRHLEPETPPGGGGMGNQRQVVNNNVQNMSSTEKMKQGRA